MDVQLIGDPNRDVWANMNSSEGLKIKPNVIAAFVTKDASSASSGVIADDKFLTFQAAEDIQPYSGELLWPYWYTSAVGATASVDEEPEAEKEKPKIENHNKKKT